MRAFYGLKQSARKWGNLCADTLIADGFEQCVKLTHVASERSLTGW